MTMATAWPNDQLSFRYSEESRTVLSHKYLVHPLLYPDQNPRMLRSQHPLLPLLLILALLCQAVIPAGAMPGTDRDHGTLTIEICTADGLRQITLPRDGADTDTPPGHDSEVEGDPCWYAACAACAMPALPQCSPLSSEDARGGLVSPASGVYPANPIAGPPLGARAPPIFTLI